MTVRALRSPMRALRPCSAKASLKVTCYGCRRWRVFVVVTYAVVASHPYVLRCIGHCDVKLKLREASDGQQRHDIVKHQDELGLSCWRSGYSNAMRFYVVSCSLRLSAVAFMCVQCAFLEDQIRIASQFLVLALGSQMPTPGSKQHMR